MSRYEEFEIDNSISMEQWIRNATEDEKQEAFNHWKEQLKFILDRQNKNGDKK